MIKDITLGFLIGNLAKFHAHLYLDAELLDACVIVPLACILLFLMGNKRNLAYFAFAFGFSTHEFFFMSLAIELGAIYEQYLFIHFFICLAYILFCTSTIDHLITSILNKLPTFEALSQKLQFEGNVKFHKTYSYYLPAETIIILFLPYCIIKECIIERIEYTSLLEAIIIFLFTFYLLVIKFTSFKNNMTLNKINDNNIVINYLFIKKTIPFSKIKKLNKIPADRFRTPRELSAFTFRTDWNLTYTVFYDAESYAYEKILIRICLPSLEAK